MSTQLIYLVLSYAILMAAILFSFLMFLTIIMNLLSKVPYVPTSRRIVKYIAEIARIQTNEKVYDLGCGDGIFLAAAQKYTKKPATGYESAPLPYYLARLRKLFSRSTMEVLMKNFFTVSLADADVIYCYLGPDVMNKVAEKVKKECRKGTRLYSHTFSIHSMKPSKVWQKNKEKRLPTVYLYKI